MKRSELFFSFLLLPLDFLMIILAGISAYFIRFSDFTTNIRPAIFEFPFDNYIKITLLVAFLWLPIFAFAGLYNIKSARKLIKEVYKVILACSTGLMLIIILIFVRRELFDSRFIVLAAWILAIIYIIFARGVVRLTQRYLFNFGIGVRKVILVGSSKTGDNLINKFSSDKTFGFEVVKRVRDFSADTSQELAKFVEDNKNNPNKDKRIDEIIQSDPNLTKVETLRLYDFADEHQLIFKYVADLLGTKVLKTELMEISGMPVIEVKKTPLEGWGRIVKRLFDLIGSFSLFIVLSPVLILVTILIKIDSKGTILFFKKDDGAPVRRVGQGGVLFDYFKFRSMIPGSDNMRYNELSDKNLRDDGPLVKIKDDPRVTRIGKFIRKWSIDEFPEIILVLMGRMSLVGPRPHLPEEVAKYEQRHKKVLTVKPGMTGLAQISGRSDLNFEEEVKLDTYYVENWSFLLDLSILLRTPLALIKKREAN
ncbi:sugar transferase [bacterium]|nr:sugar transferase [bacterium]